jgi:hypothetical protein
MREEPVFRKRSEEAWTGLMWLRIGTRCGLLLTRKRTFGYHKILWKSWLAEKMWSFSISILAEVLVTLWVKKRHRKPSWSVLRWEETEEGNHDNLEKKLNQDTNQRRCLLNAATAKQCGRYYYETAARTASGNTQAVWEVRLFLSRSFTRVISLDAGNGKE